MTTKSRIVCLGVIVASVFLSGRALAQNRIADWQIDLGRTYGEIFTANESQSTLGMLCSSKQCFFYLDTGTACESDAQYNLMMNSGAGAAAMSVYCRPLEADGRTRYVMLLGKFDQVEEALKTSAEVGFALALENGRFLVSRFSGVGFNRARTSMVQRMNQVDSDRRGRTRLRDTYQ